MTEPEIYTLINKHIRKCKKDRLPCKVSDMTPREYEIFELLTKHIAFLQYLQRTIQNERYYIKRGKDAAMKAAMGIQ